MTKTARKSCIVALLLLAPCISGAQQLMKEQGFPLNVPIQEPAGFVFCVTAEEATKLVTIQAKEGLEKAREFYMQAKCDQAPSATVLVYSNLVASVTLGNGQKRNVYKALAPIGDGRAFELYVITDWDHQRNEI